MAILVTGGTGYIGSHTCVELLEAGEEVVIIDNLYNSEQKVVGFIEEITGKKVRFYECDLLNIDDVRTVFRENQIDSVIHFAGYKAVGESVEKPLDYYENNMGATFNLCHVMKEFNCNTIVFSSSATVYGMNPNVPLKEDNPTTALNPYGWTKVMLEQVLTDLAFANKAMCVILLRYFNPVGAHASGLIGEKPKGIPNNLVPYVAKVAAGELPELQVFGDDYDTPDGTCIRDYIHVLDLASGHVKAVDYAKVHKGALAVNLGTGVGSSVLDVVKAFEEGSGIPIPYKIGPRRPNNADSPISYANPSRAKELFDGWEAKYNLVEMCRDSWNFTKNNL